MAIAAVLACLSAPAAASTGASSSRFCNDAPVAAGSVMVVDFVYAERASCTRALRVARAAGAYVQDGGCVVGNRGFYVKPCTRRGFRCRTVSRSSVQAFRVGCRMGRLRVNFTGRFGE